MAKAKSVAKKSAPAAGKGAKKPAKGGLLQSAKSAAAKLVKAAAELTSDKKGKAKGAAEKAAPASTKLAPASTKLEGVKAKVSKEASPAPEKQPVEGKGVKAAAKVAKPSVEEKAPAKAGKGKGGAAVPARPDRPRPRASKLPPPSAPLTKREMEQVLTVAQGRGVSGEGSLKGRLVVRDEFPYLMVIGRDKRELSFLLQGPDQEVLPAYVDHKVSVTGLIRKTGNHGGSVDVRKYAAKKPESESDVVDSGPVEEKLRYLSPGEVTTLVAPGMAAGVKGFATLRGNVEMTGETFVLVVSNGGTRQQVSFTLEGKTTKGLRKYLGQTVQVTGVVDKTSGWGGAVQVEGFEPRPMEYRAVSRDNLDVVELEGGTAEDQAEVKLNGGLVIRLPERVGFTWAIEPTTAKRVGLREANFEPSSGGPGMREFFFTPRNPGSFEVEFFLAKAFTPAQVAKTYKLHVNVKP